jgi:hypothetical protein
MSRDYQIKKRVNAKRSALPNKSSSKRQTKSTSERGGMVPLLRCSIDAQSCPASGSIVAVYSSDERHACIVCGRFVRVRAKYYPRKGQHLGRIPTHRHAQEDAERKQRDKEARLRCRLDRAESTARDALSRRALQKAAKASRRARSIAERLPTDRGIEQRLNRLDARVLAKRAKAQLARSAMPRDAKRILRSIVDASGFDVSAVEPDGWIDHLSGVLPERMVVSIAKQPSTRWIGLGLAALLRRSKPKTWDDLERRGFAGDRSVMAFIREFPGLELLRIPDNAYDDSVTTSLLESNHFGDVPF